MKRGYVVLNVKSARFVVRRLKMHWLHRQLRPKNVERRKRQSIRWSLILRISATIWVLNASVSVWHRKSRRLVRLTGWLGLKSEGTCFKLKRLCSPVRGRCNVRAALVMSWKSQLKLRAVWCEPVPIVLDLIRTFSARPIGIYTSRKVQHRRMDRVPVGQLRQPWFLPWLRFQCVPTWPWPVKSRFMVRFWKSAAWKKSFWQRSEPV